MYIPYYNIIFCFGDNACCNQQSVVIVAALSEVQVPHIRTAKNAVQRNKSDLMHRASNPCLKQPMPQATHASSNP